MAVAEEQAGNWWLATVVVLGMPTPPCFAGRATTADFVPGEDLRGRNVAHCSYLLRKSSSTQLSYFTGLPQHDFD